MAFFLIRIIHRYQCNDASSLICYFIQHDYFKYLDFILTRKDISSPINLEIVKKLNELQFIDLTFIYFSFIEIHENSINKFKRRFNKLSSLHRDPEMKINM